jgi:hypothetical protein
MLRPTVSRPISLGFNLDLGPKTRVLLLSYNCGFLDVGRPIWREDGSVVYNCFWSSPAQSFSGPNSAGFMTIFYCLRFETPQPGRPSPHIYFTQEQGGPVISPGTGLPFRSLLRLAGPRWRYSNPPPHGINNWSGLVNGCWPSSV